MDVMALFYAFAFACVFILCMWGFFNAIEWLLFSAPKWLQNTAATVLVCALVAGITLSLYVKLIEA